MTAEEVINSDEQRRQFWDRIEAWKVIRDTPHPPWTVFCAFCWEPACICLAESLDAGSRRIAACRNHTMAASAALAGKEHPPLIARQSGSVAKLLETA